MLNKRGYTAAKNLNLNLQRGIKNKHNNKYCLQNDKANWLKILIMVEDLVGQKRQLCANCAPIVAVEIEARTKLFTHLLAFVLWIHINFIVFNTNALIFYLFCYCLAVHPPTWTKVSENEDSLHDLCIGRIMFGIWCVRVICEWYS